MASIEETYRLIRRCTSRDVRIDPLEVVKQVEEYRQFWKPENVGVLLLGESHVYTEREVYQIELDSIIQAKMIDNYPDRFVRFVYCLGYGENDLLLRRKAGVKNAGTPQYWKIFSSCVAETHNDLGFRKILKKGTRDFLARLRNKADVLAKMKRQGIWLLDASIIGLYGSGKKRYGIMKLIIETCWENNIAEVIQECDPNCVVVIGEVLDRILYRQLRKINIPLRVIPQPQARGTSEWQLENYKEYQRICSEYSLR